MRLIPILLLSLFISVPSSYAYNKVYNYETGVGDFVGIENASKDISISCSDGQILKKTGGVWACSSDDSVAGGGTVRVSEDGTFIASADTLNFTTGVKATVATGSKLNVSSDIATTTTPGIASFDSSQFSVGSFGGVSVTGINKSLISHNLAASVDVLVSASHDAVTVTGENYASLSGQQITFGTVNDTNLTAEDFGDFTCDSGEDGCLVDANSVALGTDTTGGYAASTTEGGGATSLEADGVDALTEIAQGIKTAADDTSKLVVGTAGSNGEVAKWNTDGTLTDANVIFGTLTDGKWCSYSSSGTSLSCTQDAPAGSGDVTGVGDCADGACLDGSSDGGTYVRLYDGDSHYTGIVSSNVSANTTITLPATTGTLLLTNGAGTSLTALDGENIQDDTIDDDSIDFSDVTLADLTFDVGSVDTTEYGYLNGVTSAIQTQLDAKLALAGGTMTGELKIDETGIEGQPTDALTDCSTFSATGGGIFYDDSEGQWKKCEDNVLSDLDTGGGGGDSVSIDGVGVTDPDFVSTGQIDFVNTSNTVTANINDNSILEADLKAVDSSSDEDVLTYESTTGDFEWHSRDEIVGGISAGALPNDSIVEADLKAVDSASDEECLTYETTTGDFEWQACGSGSDTNAVKEYWWPASATLPLEAADSIPPISKDAGTNVDQLVVLFDDSTDECRTVSFKVPSDVDTSATVTFRLHWYSSSATTGSAYWDFRHNSGVADGADPDAALTTEADGGDTVAGTAGQISAATWTETITNLGWAANDQVDAVFCRDANNGSDNFSGDAYVTGFGVEIPRA